MKGKSKINLKEVDHFPQRNQVDFGNTQAQQQQNVNFLNMNSNIYSGFNINPQFSTIGKQGGNLIDFGQRSVLYNKPGKSYMNRNFQLFPPIELLINEEKMDEVQEMLQKQKPPIEEVKQIQTTQIMKNKSFFDLTESTYNKTEIKQPLLQKVDRKEAWNKQGIKKESLPKPKKGKDGRPIIRLKNPPVKIFDPPSHIDINLKKNYEDFVRDINEKDGMFHALLNREDIHDTLNNRIRVFKFLICVTVYSEDYDTLRGTLDGIYENIEIFKQKAGIGYQDVAVVVVFDGCKQIDQSVMQLFEYYDVQYQIPYDKTFDFRRKVFLNESKEEKNDWYPKQGCYTYQVHYRTPKNNQLQITNQNIDPEQQKNDTLDDYLQVFLAVKLQNNGKLSSHAYFFRAFCETFQPYYCALIDAGTNPTEDAIFKMYQALEGDPQIGGVCGYMGLNIEPIVDKEGVRADHKFYKDYDFITKCADYIFCVQKAQKFEYSMSHILDKAFESIFGFIQVLPGAFSAYRWQCLTKKQADDGIDEDNMLDQTYLVSVLDPDFKNNPDHYSLEVANMMLAEDRILCLEIFTRENFILKYVPDAYAFTDPVKYFLQLMKQRRRWINGSWFALNHVLKMYPRKLANSSHSVGRKIAFIFAMYYQVIQQLFTYLTIAIYFVFLQMTAQSVFGKYYIEQIGSQASLANLMIFLYILMVGTLIYNSCFHKAPEDQTKSFMLISTILGFYILASFGTMIYLILTLFFIDVTYPNRQIKKIVEREKPQVKILMIITGLSYLIPVLFKIHRGFKDLFLCALSYIWFSPAYIHTLLIFAFCNVDDLSWGTKGLDSTLNTLKLGKISENDRKKIEAEIQRQQANSKKIEEGFKKRKVDFVACWIFFNCIVMFILTQISTNINVKTYFVMGLAYLLTAFLGLRSVCATLYMAKYYLYDQWAYMKVVQKQKPIYQQQSKSFQKYLREYSNGVLVQKNLKQMKLEKQKEKVNVFTRPVNEIINEYNIVQVCKGKQIFSFGKTKLRSLSAPIIQPITIEIDKARLLKEHVLEADQIIKKQRQNVKKQIDQQKIQLRQVNSKKDKNDEEKKSKLKKAQSLKQGVQNKSVNNQD